MRAAALFLLLLAACSKAPDFDARYQDKAADLRHSADAMEREMAQHMNDARAAEQVAPHPGNASVP